MDYINEIIKNYNKSEKWIAKNYSSFHFFIDQLYNDITWKEKFYLYYNNIIIPKCHCGNNLKFISIKNGYRKYCSKKCLSNDPVIKEKRKITCIEKYGCDNPMKNNEVRSRFNDSIYEKYGVKNISKLEFIKGKKVKTTLLNYGVEYNSQRTNIKESLSLIMKSKSNLLNEKIKENLVDYINNKVKDHNLLLIEIIDTSFYKLKCPLYHDFEIHKNTLNDRINNKNTICTICNPINNESDAQNQLMKFIESIYDKKIIKNDRALIGSELDIYLPENSIAFEFNGIYWHSDFYKHKDYHLNKTNLCLEKGIQLIHIWEDDWKYKRSIVESRIRSILGVSNRIWGRLCKVDVVDSKKAKIFLEENHIQGYCVSKHNIGLFYKNELVSIMTFGSLRRSLGQKSQDKSYELLRFCNKLNTSVIGGASKIFKHFIKNNDINLIISYADRCWSNGNLYKRLGFRNIGTTKPNYYYVVNGVRKNRFLYRKNILVKEGYNENKTEFEIMRERGINKIFDSGNIKFIYQA